MTLDDKAIGGILGGLAVIGAGVWRLMGRGNKASRNGPIEVRLSAEDRRLLQEGIDSAKRTEDSVSRLGSYMCDLGRKVDDLKESQSKSSKELSDKIEEFWRDTIRPHAHSD